MARVLFVSKPLVPPWNDSSKNLARDVASGLERHVPFVLGDDGRAWAPPRGVVEPLYRRRGAFAPALEAQARVLARLLFGARAELWHFFFAPNPRSSAAGRVAARARGAGTIQTVCSRPAQMERARALLFADVTVVVSRATLEELRDAGVPASRLAHVPPSVPPLQAPRAEDRVATRLAIGLPVESPVVLYPGDLELGDGAPRILAAFARLRPEAILAMACRAKTPRARSEEARLRERASSLGVADRVRWIGETARIHELIAAADVVVLPSTDPFAKMDLPLVAIEALWLERAVIVAAGSPAAELAEGGAARAVDAAPEPLAHAIAALLDDDEARSSLGRCARRAAAERFDPVRMARAYETLYDRVLEERR